MTKFKRASRRRRRGFLAFEWILLITLLVIGIVGGLAAVRDSLIAELDELATAISNLYDDENGTVLPD
ncbi:MAG: hypothetical protein DWQ31_12510 [Planctomycetota bacterium]|nr:MAG: hypothetical protein DWQ31_12510 [Planctomycetota bacterium]REJ89298.1 MAG: hypothetical protein DWQ35_18350 [Planctomycetota bacterium]REK22873.1 MAG: hypothetical protein DWQ42_16315 [Planctomycetota bacterium]REK37427.1 MAG: hypothetical protein DWQ46_22360 [Planctomycetota bacterium]